MTLAELPKRWTSMPVSELLKRNWLVDHMDGNHGSDYPRSDEFVDCGVPYIAANAIESGRVNFELAKYLTPERAAKLRKGFAQDGDVLFAHNATVGPVALLKTDQEQVILGTSLTYYRCDGRNLAPIYLKCYLESHWFVSQYQRMMGQSTRNQVPITAQREFICIIPPFSEQQKIAAILSTWDRAIELTEKLIAAKQKRRQALMQQLLTGTVRLPEFQRNEKSRSVGIVRVPAAIRRGIYPPSVQPGIPKIIDRPDGWDETTMDKLLQIEKRPITLADDEEYQLVVARRNRGGIEPRETLRGRDVKTPTQFQVRAGDFVISKRQIIHGACGVVPDSLDGAVVSNEYSVCTVNGSLDMEFLKYLSHTLYFQQTCFHASVGVALEKMIFRLEQWLKFPFLIPPIDEQRAIVLVLAAMDKEVYLLSKRVTLLSQQKKGLMQQLLTGKVRVNVDAEMVKG